MTLLNRQNIFKPSIRLRRELGNMLCFQSFRRTAGLARVMHVKGGLHLARAERKLLALIATGVDDQEIASALGKTEQDVIASVAQLLVKTKTENRIELALFALAKSGMRFGESTRQ